jgi:ubiquinone/menaquinone biosynthesis C-methylase UbiE
MDDHETKSKNHAEQFARSLQFTHLKNRVFGAAALNIGFRAPFLFCEKWIAQNIPMDAKILDFGCGTGSCTLFYALQGRKMTGFDISFESVRLADRMSRDINVHDRMRLCVGSGEAIPLPDNSVDVVFSSAVLSFVDLDKALSEMTRVLKPTGTVLILDTMGHNPVLNFKRTRNLKKGARTKWSVDHILKQSDLAKMKQYFAAAKYRHFDLFVLPFALIATPLRKKKGYLENMLSPFVVLARFLDSMVLRIPGLKNLAFKTVCILSMPQKIRS